MEKLKIIPEHINAIFTNKSINNFEKELLFKKALIDYPGNEVGILYYLMLTLDFLDKVEECIDVLERIIPLLDDKDEISYMLYYQGMKNLFLKNNNKAFEQFSKAIEFSQNLAAARELAIQYNKRLDWDNVIKTCDRFEFNEEKLKLDILFLKGMAYYKKKEYEKAIIFYEKYLEIDPSNVSVMNNLGTLYGLQGRIDDNIELLLKCLKLDPNNAGTYFGLGNAYYLKADLNTTKYYFLESLKLKQDNASVYINLGSLIFEDMGDAEKGLEYLLKAQELNVEDNFILKALYESFVDVYTLLEDIDQVAFYRLKLTTLEEIVDDDDNEEEYENV